MSDSLMAVDYTGKGLTAEAVSGYVNRPLRIRVAVYTTQDHDDGLHLLLYDGDPSQGAPVIAD
jgi:hypothetical protein